MVDLSTPAALADPHAAFRELREAHGPVVFSETHRAWLVLSHAGVTAGFRSPQLSAERIPAYERMAATRPEGFSRVVDLLRGWMVFRDDPIHDRLRDPVRRAFTPRRIASVTPAIERSCDDLLDGLVDGASLRDAYAAPLPALVIADLLAVPRDDRPTFQAWSDLLSRVVFAVDAKSSAAEPAIAGAEHFWSYFGALVAERRRSPGDDLVSDIVAAGLTDDEAVGACTLLLFAGHSTTAGLLENGTALLLQSAPGEVARLRADPSLWSTAPDELLRLEGPAKLMVRRTLADVTLDGVTVPAGHTVWLCILAADRDPATFGPAADACDVGRDPNPHVAFGWGIHHCLGAALARLEGRIALRRLFERFPALALANEPRWGGSLLGRAVSEVRVSTG